MYRVNPLQRKVLIVSDEVIFHAGTTHTMDPRKIDNSIIVAEEGMIRATLGYGLYADLVDKKNKIVTEENKAEIESEINDSLPDSADDVTLAVGDIVNALEFLSDDYKTLWKEHLWKLTAECVMLVALPEGFVQFGSEGAIHTNGQAGPMNSQGIVTPELKSMKWSIDKKMMMRIDPLRESMHLWLCTQRKAYPSKYSLYDKACDCNVDGVAYKRKTDIILGLYDNDDRRCGC